MGCARKVSRSRVRTRRWSPPSREGCNRSSDPGGLEFIEDGAQASCGLRQPDWAATQHRDPMMAVRDQAAGDLRGNRDLASLVGRLPSSCRHHSLSPFANRIPKPEPDVPSTMKFDFQIESTGHHPPLSRTCQSHPPMLCSYDVQSIASHLPISVFCSCGGGDTDSLCGEQLHWPSPKDRFQFHQSFAGGEHHLHGIYYSRRQGFGIPSKE